MNKTFFFSLFSLQQKSEKRCLVLLGAEEFVDIFWEAHVFLGVLMLLQDCRIQHGAFGVRGPGHGAVVTAAAVAQSLAQTGAVPE